MSAIAQALLEKDREIDRLRSELTKAERERDEYFLQWQNLRLTGDWRASEATNQALRTALERAERKLSAYVGVCKGDKELTDTVLPMVREALAVPTERREDATGLGTVGNLTEYEAAIKHADEIGKARRAERGEAGVTEAMMKWMFSFRENWPDDGSIPNDFKRVAEAYATNIDPWEAAAAICEERPLDPTAFKEADDGV